MATDLITRILCGDDRIVPVARHPYRTLWPADHGGIPILRRQYRAGDVDWLLEGRLALWSDGQIPPGRPWGDPIGHPPGGDPNLWQAIARRDNHYGYTLLLSDEVDGFAVDHVLHIRFSDGEFGLWLMPAHFQAKKVPGATWPPCPDDCAGHPADPAGPGPGGETEYCDGTCRPERRAS